MPRMVAALWNSGEEPKSHGDAARQSQSRDPYPCGKDSALGATGLQLGAKRQRVLTFKPLLVGLAFLAADGILTVRVPVKSITNVSC